MLTLEHGLSIQQIDKRIKELKQASLCVTLILFNATLYNYVAYGKLHQNLKLLWQPPLYKLTLSKPVFEAYNRKRLFCGHRRERWSFKSCEEPQLRSKGVYKHVLMVANL